MQREATVSNKTVRLLALLESLPKAPYSSTASMLRNRLAERGHALTVRSIERYLQELSASAEFGYMLICDESQRPFRWSLSANHNYSLPSMDAGLATTLDLLSRYLRPLLSRDALTRLKPYFNEAQRWFKRHGSSLRRSWSDKVAYLPRSMALQQAPVDLAVSDAIYDSLHYDHALRIVYNNHDSEKVVFPYALVDHGPVRYLIVRFEGFEDYRHLAVHRIQQAHRLEQSTPDANLFNLDAYLSQGGLRLPVGDDIAIELRFLQGAGDHLRETPLVENQTLTDEGEAILRVNARVPDTQELRWWILGFGSRVEVLAPEALRKDIADTLKAALSRYKNDSP